MGKNHRHQKKLKSEKSKIQIKTSKTKFLPKGQNITNTTFKIKPIIIQEQLKERDTNQLLSRKKQTLSELVSKLKHHNDKLKIEACENLIEMIKQQSIQILHKYFSTILQTISNLIQDRERKVRHNSIKLINEILQQTTVEQFEPFFNYLSTNLRCAMTNIDRNIQEDSLLLLDCLLKYLPGLVSNDSDKIFPDFLTLISKLRNDSNIERTLTVNLGSKVTSVRWRIKVLSRLFGILKAIINREQFEENLSINRDDSNINKYFNDSYFIPIYTNNCDLYEMNSINYLENSTKSSNNNVLQMYIGTLVPLLYETWLEVVPEKSLKRNMNDITVLNEESAAILSCIVNILHLLYQYTGRHQQIDQIFPPKQTEQFFDYLLSNFPYGQNRKRNQDTISKDMSKLFTIKDDQKCTEENLLICYQFCVLKLTKNSTAKDYRNKINIITNYINKFLSTVSHVSPSNFQLLLGILNDLLLENSKFWRRYQVNTIEIMENLINFYQQLSINNNNNNNNDYQSIIIKLLTSSELFLRSQIYQDWLKKLPELLLKTKISIDIIDILLQLSRQNCLLIHQGLQEKFEEILGNLPNLEILPPSSDTLIKNKIVYIFFYLTDLEENLIWKFIEIYPDLTYSKLFSEMLQIRNVLKT